MKNDKETPSEGFNSEKTNKNQNPNNGEVKMNRKTINLNKLTDKQIKKMANTIVKRGVYSCHNGVEIRYKVSELDILNREVQPIDVFGYDSVHPFDVIFLLREVYGVYPKNKLIDNYFTIIRN